jgi:hypothetical protein
MNTQNAHIKYTKCAHNFLVKSPYLQEFQKNLKKDLHTYKKSCNIAGIYALPAMAGERSTLNDRK